MAVPFEANPFRERLPPKETTPPPSEAPPSSGTQIEHFIDAALLEILERQARKINEGQNGVIFRLNVGKMPKRALERLARAGIDLEGENVMKVLKLSVGGIGKQEFDMQSRAYEILSGQPEPEKLAKIPTPKMYRNLYISEETRQYLESYGIKTYSNLCEVIVMDEVHGDDVATALYREVARRHPGTVHLKDHIDEMDFSDLQEVVSNALAFARPGGKSKDEQERKFEERKVFLQNSSKLFQYLANTGFRINPSIVEKMEKTMDVLHEHQLCHRDAHHRNFMVKGDLEQKPGQPDPEVYLIDFGTMSEFQGPYSEELFAETLPSGEVVRYVNDGSVPRDLRKYLLNDKEKIRDQQFAQQLDGLAKRLLSRTAVKAQLEQFPKNDPEMGLKKIAMLAMPPKPDTLLVMIRELLGNGSLDGATARTFLESEKKRSTPSDALKIEHFIRLLK